MNTLRRFSAPDSTIPVGTSWYLADLGEFTLSLLEQACPGVSRDMIRRVLRQQRQAGALVCQGRGPAARWRKKG